MKLFPTVGLVCILIVFVRNISGSETERIRLVSLDFYNDSQLEYDVVDTLAKRGEILLDYKLAGRFKIKYSVDSLKMGEIVKYKIEGFDRIWITDDDSQSIMVTNLEAGSYIVRIGIFRGPGLIEEKAFKIVIASPFWKSYWFRMLIMISTVIIILSIFKRKTGTKKISTKL